jgi:hypothetical protein
MSDIHIDDFYRDTALILLRLYNRFPRPQLLFVEEICGAGEPDEFGMPPARQQACFGAMIWLGQQGFLRYDATLRQEGLDQAVLTERGFLMLASSSPIPAEVAPDALKPELPESLRQAARSNAARLRRALQSGSSTELGRCMLALLQHSTPR